ncbi:PPA1309 family protein [Georgenia sp. Z1491]|uniref:PPA1309 family protein n=1 Tax=Georgenia sp. Z1491 TaxID=3416707 RepID=UPI003CF4E405
MTDAPNPPEPGPTTPGGAVPAAGTDTPSTDGAAPSPRTSAVRAAVLDLERHAARAGWDGPVIVAALVRTGEALAADPSLETTLGVEAVLAGRTDPDHLFAVEQEGLPESDTLDELLGQLAWPDEVAGAAIVVERIVVPPEAEAGLPSDPEESLRALREHPSREDVRMAVGVLRSGESWCALRTRAHDDDTMVAGSPDAVPGLVHALAATLS